MSKKNISLIAAGILIQVLQFNITLGIVKIDIFLDILAYILILVGISPLIIRNNLFKKVRNTAIYGLIVSILIQAAYFIDWGDAQTNAISLFNGVITIFSIYTTYYFTESIILEAKMQEKSALTRTFRMTWAVLGAFIFISYIAFLSNISILSIISQAITILSVLYYISSILNACRQLYTLEIPKQSIGKKQ